MRGLLLAVAAYGTWGCFPLFFSLVSHVSATEVLANRVVWSLFSTLLVILLLRRGSALLAVLLNREIMLWLVLSSVLIAINWLVFIWAVAQHHVMESSLGYYMTPLVSLILARLFLKETLHPIQAVAAGLATLAVLWELFSLGSLPWVSIVLAMSFGLYGLVRKRTPVTSLNGLTVETLVLLPLALLWLGWMSVSPAQTLALGTDISTTGLLVASGILTAIPLLLFAAAAQRLDLSVLGFIMYINPTMQFLIALFVFDEAFPPQRLVTFVLVWIALSLFMWGMWRGRDRTAADVSVGDPK